MSKTKRIPILWSGSHATSFALADFQRLWTGFQRSYGFAA